MKIAFFDFDGTITTDDSLLKFIRFVVGNFKFIQGLTVLSPVLFLYKLKVIPNYKAKQMMLSYFFKGMSEKSFIEVAKKYSLEHIDSIVREDAMKQIQWHHTNGHKVVVVSASLECWLHPWCEKNGLELIGTRLEVLDGIITGRLLTKNCYGIEKVNRIKSQYNLEEYEYIYAYGDSRGDREMLELAQKKAYKPFR
ncbi:HAD-IB family hydrolase [Sulfurospirillum multivorans]|uniref:Phosphotransferase n=2 Tax=Sulfurospirillum multivorans TaxID=66821 RepID=A0AA86E0C0_SULMK|nr:HAD-IB family hydrolase [Sulfurospirillum multivorans]AHJ13780.1 phosphotransferase [Sulfurospirillum multivorans DSM 12446]QEH07270.1 phosphotransferase [Sulfurospirillum multivorans]